MLFGTYNEEYEEYEKADYWLASRYSSVSYVSMSDSAYAEFGFMCLENNGEIGMEQSYSSLGGSGSSRKGVRAVVIL